VAVLKDEAGNTVCDTDNEITFRIQQGPGKLLTDTGDYVRQPVNGIATMLLRSTTVPGDIFVSAACGGVAGETLYFTASGEEALELGKVTNFPNPFSSGTTFTYDLRFDADALTIRVFSITGRLIWQANPGEIATGYHNYYWDGRDTGSVELANGTYYYKITAVKDSDRVTRTGKLVKIK